MWLSGLGRLLIVFLTKVNLLYLLYSMDRRCCLLHLIKQNYLLKTFLATLILMTLVSWSWVLEAAKLVYANKTKESITSQKLGSWDFYRIANSVFNKGKYAISPLFNSLWVLSSASDKAKLFAENFFKNSNLDDSGISLPFFPSRTNLKLHNISVTPKMVKKVITNIDSSKASGRDCISVVVLKSCEPKRS